MPSYRIVLIAAIAVLVAFFVPVAHADKVLKTDAKSKIQLKSEASKISGDLTKSLTGIAKVDKTLKYDPTGTGSQKETVTKSLKFDFKPKTKLGDLKLKSFTKTGKFDLKKMPEKISKKLDLTYLEEIYKGQSIKKTASFTVPLLLGLDVTNSGLISGFSLDWLPNNPPVPSDPATGLSLLGLSARTVVAEPATILLLASGLLGLAVGTRKRTARPELA